MALVVVRNSLYSLVDKFSMCTGDWKISILSDGQNISGSPFHVRVYDPGQVKVHGLQGGSMGQPVNFAGNY